MNKPIRILIVDDHAIFRKGLNTLIISEPGMMVVGEAADGVEAVQMVSSLQPDIVLLDIMMPQQDGLWAINQIKSQDPEARILVLTSFADDDKVFPAIKAGALGYLLKDALPEQLFQAIRDVYRGESSLHPSIAYKVLRELKRPPDLPPTKKPLTKREMQILILIAQGLTNQEIAEKLSIKEGTVGNHISNILSKLHLANRTQVALYALQEGFADFNQESLTINDDL